MGLPVKTLSRDEWKGEMKKEAAACISATGSLKAMRDSFGSVMLKKPMSSSLNGQTYDILADGVFGCN